jgi:hypothetical protein
MNSPTRAAMRCFAGVKVAHVESTRLVRRCFKNRFMNIVNLGDF